MIRLLLFFLIFSITISCNKPENDINVPDEDDSVTEEKIKAGNYLFNGIYVNEYVNQSGYQIDTVYLDSVLYNLSFVTPDTLKTEPVKLNDSSVLSKISPLPNLKLFKYSDAEYRSPGNGVSYGASLIIDSSNKKLKFGYSTTNPSQNRKFHFKEI